MGTQTHISLILLFVLLHVMGCFADPESSVPANRVRLVGGAGPYEGRVELWTGQRWGTVCDTHWDVRDAMVVCRELDLNRTAITVWEAAHFGKGSGPIMGLLDCYGNERRVSDCYNRGWGNNYCRHRMDAGVTCAGSSFNVRLVNGSSPREGRVEVEVEGEWGVVCDDGWGWRAAQVVCRQLGFQNEGWVAVPWGRAEFGQGQGPVWMEEVGCEGTESTLLDCPFPGWQLTNCDNSEAAGVTCDGSFSLRLAGGSNSREGRVEVEVNGVWGTVCGRWGWTDRAAKVICRQLGLPSANAQAWTDAHFGIGSGPILMARIWCQGNETHFLDCFSVDGTFFFWEEFCSHYQDAGVTCA